MSMLFLIRLALDLTAAGLLVVALAYYAFDNAMHELVGVVLFLLLLVHNLFNRRWWQGLAKGRRDMRSVVTKVMNAGLLVTMLAVLVTSIMISQTVFGFLSITSTFTSRQIHASAAYWALLIVSIHLGWHWSMFMDVARRRLGVTAGNAPRTWILRGIALLAAICGVRGVLAADLTSKLFMQMSLDPFAVPISTPEFLWQHVAMVGLGTCVAHYASAFLQGLRLRVNPGSKRGSPKCEATTVFPDPPTVRTEPPYKPQERSS